VRMMKGIKTGVISEGVEMGIQKIQSEIEKDDIDIEIGKRGRVRVKMGIDEGVPRGIGIGKGVMMRLKKSVKNVDAEEGREIVKTEIEIGIGMVDGRGIGVRGGSRIILR
jgi:hypothetical protein